MSKGVDGEKMNGRKGNDEIDDIDLGLSLSLKGSVPKSHPPIPSNTISLGSSSALLSPDSTISTSSGKRSERVENESEKYSTSFEGGGADDSLARKKMKFSSDQARMLEETFNQQSIISQDQKVALAKKLNLKTRQVEVWFQNRRSRTKTKNTEVENANMKEEILRLKKENADLRAAIAINPPTTGPSASLHMALQDPNWFNKPPS